MGSKTGIQWTDATWNPIIGCSRVSEGCRNCYAEGIAGRFGQGKPTVYSGLTQIVNGRAVWTGQIAETKQLLQPLSWKQPKRIFVNSMSDLFHENVTDEQRDKIFTVMALCPHHTFQVLTKRPGEMLRYLSSGRIQQNIILPLMDLQKNGGIASKPVFRALDVMRRDKREWKFPLPNVWLGVSVENQKTADDRIPMLLITPAAVRFLSCEPLLGEIDLWTFLYTGVGSAKFNRLHWVICGGESGPHARPMGAEWPRSIRDQCVKAEIPFFFKQWGAWLPALCDGATTDKFITLNCADQPIRVGKKAAGALLDGREWKQFPEVL
jgi:protein gp37